MKQVARLVGCAALPTGLWYWTWWAPFAPEPFQYLPITAGDIMVGGSYVVLITAVFLRLTRPEPPRRRMQ